MFFLALVRLLEELRMNIHITGGQQPATQKVVAMQRHGLAFQRVAEFQKPFFCRGTSPVRAPVHGVIASWLLSVKLRSPA